MDHSHIETLITSGRHRDALALCCEAFAAAIGRYCAAMIGSDAEAEELVQEALLEAYAAMPGFRGEAPVRAWLFGIARRRCIRHLRKRDRRAGLIKRWLAPAAEPTAPDRHAATEARLTLRAAFQALRPAHREAVLLRYQAGLDGRELALALGVSHVAARKRVSLGLAGLREALRPILMAPGDPADAGTQAPGEVDHERPVSSNPRPRIVSP